jgi:hypothetical protein
MYKYCIIGFGISGQILLLELIKANINPKDIILCDETFLGGDLMLKYGSVMSNTPWFKTKTALEAYTANLPNFPPEKCTPVREIAKACLEVALQTGKHVEKLTTTVTSLIYTTEWEIKHLYGTIYASTVFITIGGKENQLDISIPTIPLSIALDKEQLKHVISQDDIISVFGTSHSGTIVLDNLESLQIQTYGIYKTPEPFQFEPESYSGLKEGSSVIAKAILNNEYKQVTIIPWNDPLVIHKALRKTTKAIVATGFKPKSILGDKFIAYEPSTGKLMAGPNLYGFGLAYPGVTVQNTITYQDNSVLSYQSQIQKCLPNILKA